MPHPLPYPQLACVQLIRLHREFDRFDSGPPASNLFVHQLDRAMHGYLNGYPYPLPIRCRFQFTKNNARGYYFISIHYKGGDICIATNNINWLNEISHILHHPPALTQGQEAEHIVNFLVGIGYTFSPHFFTHEN
jgi:hypothetical protein